MKQKKDMGEAVPAYTMKLADENEMMYPSI